MTPFEFLLAFIFTVIGGILGIRRLGLISLVFIAGFLSFAAYRAFHLTLANSIYTLGFSQVNSFFFSLFFVTLIPFFASFYLGLKIIDFLRLNELESSSDNGVNVIDKIFGSGFGLIIFLILFSIFRG